MQLGSHVHIPKSVSVKEWTHTSQVDSHFGNWNPYGVLNFQIVISGGHNSLDWKVLYTIGKFLKHWYLKWACMTHLNTYDISCDQKKGSEWKCQFDSWSLKVNNRLELCVCRWCVTYHWKYLEKGYNFSLKFTSIIGLHKKLWASKLSRVPISKISRLLTWKSREKWHLGATPMANHREYYKGGRWWLPPSLGRGESCELVYARGSSVHQKCSNYALTNLLFGLRMFIWNIDFFCHSF
jgi:hypothetical protein